MIIREPVVHAIYYYLREAPGDNVDRRHAHHEAFITDTHRKLQSIAGWLSMPEADLPKVPFWDDPSPEIAQPLMQTGELKGRVNASAWLSAYVLRNMLLLRVMVARSGEHDQTVWSMLNESLGEPPTSPTWLDTAHYWCGVAPRPPEDLEHSHLMPIKTPFGVLCLGQGDEPNLLVYSDARTEHRANHFLRSLAARLDWYTVQASYRLSVYENRASSAARNQQHALDRVTQSVQQWAAAHRPDRLRSLAPLQAQLETLEGTYQDVLSDLAATQTAAQEMRGLVAEYRLTLMQSGLWDAAPSVWEAQVAALGTRQAQIESDVNYIDTTLRRSELILQGLQTRIALLQGERDRLQVYLIAVLGLALLAVLIADVRVSQMVMRVLTLLFVFGIVWIIWQSWLQKHSS
jgi:hypothetical protein